MALAHIQCHSPGIIEICAAGSDVQVEIMCLRVGPHAKPAVWLSQQIFVPRDEHPHLIRQIHLRRKNGRPGRILGEFPKIPGLKQLTDVQCECRTPALYGGIHNIAYMFCGQALLLLRLHVSRIFALQDLVHQQENIPVISFLFDCESFDKHQPLQ